MSEEKVVAHIHSEKYLDEYVDKEITHDSLVFRTNRKVERLNGLWHFVVDQYDTGLRMHWPQNSLTPSWERHEPWDYGWDEGELVPVPSCWNMVQPQFFYYEGTAWYARRFSYKAEVPDERIVLRIGAANYDTKVFLNGEYLGFHRGGSTPFCLELTGLLQEDNLLQICVNNERFVERVPGRNTDWFNYGGLYRDVELLRLPRSLIKEFFMYLVPDNSYSTIVARVIADGAVDGDPVTITVPDLGIEANVPVKNGLAEFTFTCRPELWSPEQPRLYDAYVSCGQDSVWDRIGFRQIETKGTSIYLNGKRTFLRGICVHEDDAVLGKSTTEEAVRKIFAHAKELGCNFVRLAHYPHTELAAQIADEVGLLLWEELPVYWTVDFANPVTYADAENQLLELIKRDQNRASVIIWSVGNENADTDDRLEFMSKLVEAARRRDPSRLIAAACIVERDRLAKYIDVIGINEYYGWYIPDYAGLQELLATLSPEKPVVISETGAGALAGHHGPKTELFTEEFMAEVYRNQIEHVKDIDFVAGFSPWILYDFRAPRRCNRYQQGYNRKGIIAADKETRKQAFYVLQELYQRTRKEGR